MAANATTTVTTLGAVTMNFVPAAPVTGPVRDDLVSGEQPVEVDGVLELSDGSAFRGFSFGAQGKSVAGECVFQTGEFVIFNSVILSPFFPSIDSGSARSWDAWASVREFERLSEALSLSIF